MLSVDGFMYLHKHIDVNIHIYISYVIQQAFNYLFMYFYLLFSLMAQIQTVRIHLPLTTRIEFYVPCKRLACFMCYYDISFSFSILYRILILLEYIECKVLSIMSLTVYKGCLLL